MIYGMKQGRKLPKDIEILAAFVVFLVTMAVLIVISADRREDADPEPLSVLEDSYINMSLEEKEELVYRNLLKAGLSPAGACGIMGSIAVESPDFDPSAENEISGAYGLFQWTDDGDRKQAFIDYCTENDMSRDSVEAQLSFAIYEIGGADPIACRLDSFLRETDDAYTAAAEFTVGFERCITDDAGQADTYTGSLYPEFYGSRYQNLSKRINKAMNYYKRFEEGQK